MREIKRLRPGTDPKMFAEYQKAVRDVAVGILKPCKDHGRDHLASIIGKFVASQHNKMTLICAGIKERPKTKEEQTITSTEAAVAGILIMALVRMVEHSNTQWDDPELFYDQLVNQIENSTAATETALIREL